MMGHKICFYGKILVIIPKLPQFPYLIWSPGSGALHMQIEKSLTGRHNHIQSTLVISTSIISKNPLSWKRKSGPCLNIEI